MMLKYKSRYCLPHGTLSSPKQGFSLPELMVTIVILGIFSSIAIPSFFNFLQREKLQSVALEIAGWLELVRNSAANQVSVAANAGGCEITFFPGLLSVNTPLAEVDQACATTVSTPVLRVPEGVQQDSVQVAVVGSNPFVFTPRGMWINNQGAPGQSFVVSLNLGGAGGPLRCVRLTPTLGSVEIGRPQGSATCNNWESL
jgi:prepilin-type N-terminal cleavage/methylation domain-containing protein